MRNIITASFLALLFACSCVSKKSAERIMAEKDTLALEIETKDLLINDIFVSMSAIVDNLEDIKARENIISGNISGGEIPRQYTSTISEDIQAIDRLLQSNRETIEQLRSNVSKLSEANIKIAGLDKLAAQLLDQVEEKDDQIQDLKTTLSTMNIKVEQLEVEVEQLEVEVEQLNLVNQGLSGEIKAQEELLNTCYYIVGDEKELISRKIVYKSGFIGRTLKINENHSLESYTRTNINTAESIYVGHRKAEIVTHHPADSYVIKIGTQSVVESIDIIDKEKFWSTSKILIVSYK